jgi:hypothetical protein
MLRMLLPLLFAGLSIGAPVGAADTPNVCAVFPEAEAVKLLGGPLGEVYKPESKPTPQNGYEHQTGCGYFPKGYDYDKTEAPPNVGILVSFQTMRNDADAKRLYEAGLRMGQSAIQGPGSAKFTPVSGMGEGGYLTVVSMPNSPARANLTFLKGKIVVAVVVWKTAAAVDDMARVAAKQVLGRLP